MAEICCYGLVIEEDGKVTISGDPFMQIDDTERYQILRSTYCSLKWKPGAVYALHFVKYNTNKNQYLQYAHTLRESESWRRNIIATFNITYNINDYTYIYDVKTVKYISTDNKWRLSMNVFESDFCDILTLPYVAKITDIN
jgi:hypothetical protein